jgi:hydroxymethylbilane synthase
MARSLPTAARIGTRGSVLARRQTAIVAELLLVEHPFLDVTVQVITTVGDEIADLPLTQLGGAGIFTSNLERALDEGRIDLAVHSIKDLPTGGGTLGAVLRRGNPSDVLISRRGYTLATLPSGATVGTCSHRRASQLRHARPDLVIRDIRGNVDTRLEKAFAADGAYDAIVLAYAGLERLGRLNVISEVLPFDVMLPAPGQAALGVQCRADGGWLRLLRPLNHAPSQLAVEAERALLAALEGGCSLPIAAYAAVDGDALHLRGRVLAPDGTQQIDAEARVILGADALTDARSVGVTLAEALHEQGAGRLLEGVG